jgi:hypothetical protein|tara:strand:+ start:908 stop:1483 length:576 start_codon:yes stop_codon:yes gene_type:complete
MEILEALEASAYAMWIKESSTAYVAFLAFHSIGMAFLVGISGATAMRVLGIARSIPLEPMHGFFPLMYAGFWINAVTGVVLLSLYPTQFLLDLNTYIKLAAVVAAMVIILKLQAHVFGDGAGMDTPEGTKKAKMLARALLTVWFIAVVAGRVMAYGLTTKLQTAGAAIVTAIVALVILYFAGRKYGWIESS